MVSFLSLFLGLVMGPQTVALEVAAPVARIEILLDGSQIAAIDGPPWRRQIDLGPELQPHELTAVAFDAAGAELDRTSQWLNLPRQPAETTILLEADPETGNQQARISWKSLTGDEPSAIRVEFDGRELEFNDPHVVSLPAYDPEVLHFLRVELEFAGFVTSSAEITFGGAYTDQVNTELTAFPVKPTKGHKKLPPESELSTGFRARGKTLRLAAVEKGPVELIVVRDQGSWSELRRIRGQALSAPASGRLGTGSRGNPTWFRSDRSAWDMWTFQFLWPTPRRLESETGPYDLFSHSAKHTAATGSLHGWLTTVEQPSEWTGDQRLADAVAIAGVTAAGGNRRRGVLVVLGDQTEDYSDATADTVRRYLESLAVPLFVWTVGTEPSDNGAWGPTTDASGPRLMSRATQEVFRQLERQRIVWVEGLHLPQQITLAPTLQDRIE